MSSRRGIGIVVVVVAVILVVFLALWHRGRRVEVLIPTPPPFESTQVLPTGMTITPVAALGSYFLPLNPDLPGLPGYVAGQPVTTCESPDGKTLLVLTSGYNRIISNTGRRVRADSKEYVFVFDISQGAPHKTQVLEVPNTFDGIAWNPNGQEFYVSGGVDDDVHVFAKKDGQWAEEGRPIRLGHKRGLGIDVKPEAAGLAVTADGKKLIVANFENDSISEIDLTTHKKIAEQDLRPGKIDPKEAGVPGGEFPLWVVTLGNDRAYVSSPRDRQIVVLDISAQPRVTSRIAVPGGPTKMILDRSQKHLFVALPTDDLVAVINTEFNKVIATISTTAPTKVFSNPHRLMGSNPNGLALSPDGKTLYVTNGGANSIAVIDLAEAAEGKKTAGKSEIVGLIPTAWYPSSVSVSGDGKTLYVTNTHSVPGPNPGGCRNTTSIQRNALGPCRAQNEYILQLSKGGFEVMPTPGQDQLPSLTKQVAENDHYGPDPKRAADEKLMAFLHRHIQHVIYIVKENRTYDQVLGDLPEGNGDPHLTVFPQPLTPNHHQLAKQFVDLDNFYDSGEVSGNGWNWSTSARASEMVDNTIPLEYAYRGLSYDYEGDNRNINVGFATLAERRAANPETPDEKNLLPGTADVDAPDGPGGEAGTGYLWDAALRAKLSVRNYGFFIDLDRYDDRHGAKGYIPPLTNPYATKTQVAFATKAALENITDPYFRGFDLKLPDYWRFQEWNREFRQYEAKDDLPNLEMVRFMRDHLGEFGQAIEHAGTVETEMADNDYAIGLLVEKIAQSPYKNNTIVCIIEDDAQNGPDHVDAHRSLALIAGAYVKQGAVVSTHYTTVNMLATIEEILGMGPMGINDDVLAPMADVFTTKYQPWDYTAQVPEVLRTTKIPLPPKTAAEKAQAATPEAAEYAKPRHDAAYWATKTEGMDFHVEDHINSARFNRILWRGMMGRNVPYPTVRNGRDLRQGRRKLLQRYWETRERRAPDHSAVR